MTDTITTDLDPAPSRQRPTVFSAEMDAFLGKLPTWADEANTLATGANANKVAAEAAQTAAEAAQTAAELAETGAEAAVVAASIAADATVWAVGTTYAAGQVVMLSTDDYKLYTSQQAANTGNNPGTDDGTWWVLTISNHTHETLTRGTGLTGSDYNGGTARTFAVDIGADADVRAGTANKVVSTDKLYSASAPVTLTDAVTVAVDLNSGRNFIVTLGGNRTLGNPTNIAAGQSGVIVVKKSETRTLSYASYWKFAGGAPTLTVGATTDVISYWVESTTFVHCTFLADIS